MTTSPTTSWVISTFTSTSLTNLIAVLGAILSKLVKAFSVWAVANSSNTPLTAKIKIKTAPSAYSPVRNAASEAAIIKNSTFKDFS